MTTVLLIVLCFAFCGYREFLWSKERSSWKEERENMHDRLMAKDLTEYREEIKLSLPPKAPSSKFVTIVHKQNSPSKGGD